MTSFSNARLQQSSDPFTRLGAAALLATLLTTGLQAATGTDQAGLQQRLMERGWQASPDAAGNTLLYPPTTAAPLPAIAQATTTNPPDLQELLRQRGWVIRESEAGTTLQLLIDPPAEAPATVEGTPQPAGSRAQDVFRMLEERGWNIHQDASGNTLLIPTRGSTPQAKDETAGGATTPDSMADFRRAAEATGWRIDSEADGSLIMYPPGAATARSAPTSTGSNCPGTVTSSIATGAISLPLADSTAARQLAQEWLGERGRGGRTIGRLRRINRIYVVSIVDDAPPFQLRNQLVIRSDNGHVIPVF